MKLAESQTMNFPLSVSGPQHNKTVVCYISTWAVYRPGRGSFNIDNFDPSLCTIAIYAFAGLDPATDAIRSLGELNFLFN
jgi:chitinase